jgi:hypothetical protein
MNNGNHEKTWFRYLMPALVLGMKNQTSELPFNPGLNPLSLGPPPFHTFAAIF